MRLQAAYDLKKAEQNKDRAPAQVQAKGVPIQPLVPARPTDLESIQSSGEAVLPQPQKPVRRRPQSGPDLSPEHQAASVETVKIVEPHRQPRRTPWMLLRLWGLCAVGWLVGVLAIKLPPMISAAPPDGNSWLAPDGSLRKSHLFPWLFYPIACALPTWLTGGWTMARAPRQAPARPYLTALAWGIGAAIAQIAWVFLWKDNRYVDNENGVLGFVNRWDVVVYRTPNAVLGVLGFVHLAYVVFMEATTRRVEKIRSARRWRWRTIIRAALWFSLPLALA